MKIKKTSGYFERGSFSMKKPKENLQKVF